MELYDSNNVRVFSLFGPEKDGLNNEFDVEWHGEGNTIVSKIKLVLRCLWEVIFWKPRIIFVTHVNFSGFVWVLSKISGSITVLNIYGLEVWGALSKDARVGLKNVDHVVSDCHYTARLVESSGTRPEESISVIWDCVDLTKFRPRPDLWESVRSTYNLPNRDQYFIILSLGRLSRDAAYKGYERLLEAFHLLKSRYSNIKLVFAGKGDLIDNLKERAIHLNIQNDVHFTGSVAEEDMAGVYSYAHVFSLISHRDENSGEGIPLTPLEAMACEVPIMVGNQDGSQEAVFDNRNGIVLNPFDIPSQAGFISVLIENSHSRQDMAHQAREIAEKFFSYEIFKEKHAQLINQIIT